MYKTVILDDMVGVSALLTEQTYRRDLDRYRSVHIYRGMPNADYSIVTSLQRLCKEKRFSLEPSILENFTKYAALEDPTIETSVWRQMILGQHHGLPTRLLDWSFSPLVGLHFATIEPNMEEMDDHDSVVWRVDVDELHDLLPPKYQQIMERTRHTVFSVKMLQEVCSGPQAYDEDMGGRAMLVVEPPSIEQRIINQFSFFSIVPLDIVDVADFLNQYTQKTVKYVIKKELRWQVRDLLDQLNISERIIYPGLDGLSSWLARHFFVRETEQDGARNPAQSPSAPPIPLPQTTAPAQSATAPVREAPAAPAQPDIILSHSAQGVGTLEYRPPTLRDELALRHYLQEHLRRGEHEVILWQNLLFQNYAEWVTLIRHNADSGHEEWGKSMLLLCYDGTALVGVLSIRYELSPVLEAKYGTIGFGVRPSRREQGYATKMLREALRICREKGRRQVLLGCREDNLAAATVIQRCGGVLLDTVKAAGGVVNCYYQISLE